MELSYLPPNTVESVQQITDDLVKRAANGRIAESGCHMLKRITRRAISEVGIKLSRKDKAAAAGKTGNEVAKSAGGADHFSEKPAHSAPAKSPSDKPNPAAPANATGDKKVSSKPRSSAQVKAPAGQVVSNYSIETARAAFSECAAQANRFVVGTPGHRETADATFVYSSEGPLDVPKKLLTTRPRDGRPPLRFETALEGLTDIRDAREDFNKQSAHLANYTRQFNEVQKQMQQKSKIKRLMNPPGKHLIENAESLHHMPASILIAETTRIVNDGLANINALKSDPYQRELAVDTANEGNARWKIDGFVKLHQRLEKITSSFIPTAQSSRSSSPQREKGIDSESRKDSVMNFGSLGATNSAKMGLAEWHADLAEYRGFLSDLEAQYSGNKLTRGS